MSNISKTFRKLKESLVNDYVSPEDLNEYGHNNLGDFLEDTNAFNMWYTDQFESLDAKKRYMLLKDIEMKEHRDQAILMLEEVVTEDGINPARLKQTQINLMDMISDD
tara:strand:+ start:458 stop:781 length:324 start_codon:yes stop_codon:yes gene_type:complete